VFLNHGSFGACPRAVLDAQSELRRELERDPVRFFDRVLRSALPDARDQLARFVGAEPDDVAFVNNATTAINAVVRSIELASGDEILTTDHEYNATRNVLDVCAARVGGRVVTAELPFPVDNELEVIDAILAGVTGRTRLVVVDHVTSQTALVLPVAPIARELCRRGIDLLVDGAHAPGQLDLHVAQVGATYYVGNCHKWLCAPKGVGFLWVHPDRRERVRPAVISHGANAPVAARERFRAEFEWTGTDDPTAALCVPVAIRIVEEMVTGGWPALRRRNHQLAVAARRSLCDALGVEPPCPDAMIGSMAAVPLPPSLEPRPPHGAVHPLQARLYDDYRIQVPVFPWPRWPAQLVRVSAHVHNRLDEYERLASALVALLGDATRPPAT
jgi:isopenicillin-N epimerase